jgi:hypothetical protein
MLKKGKGGEPESETEAQSQQLTRVQTSSNTQFVYIVMLVAVRVRLGCWMSLLEADEVDLKSVDDSSDNLAQAADSTVVLYLWQARSRVKGSPRGRRSCRGRTM